MIIEGKALRGTPSEIGKALNLSRNIIKIIIQRHLKRDNSEFKSRSEKPHKLSKREERRILRFAQNNSRITYV